MARKTRTEGGQHDRRTARIRRTVLLKGVIELETEVADLDGIVGVRREGDGLDQLHEPQVGAVVELLPSEQGDQPSVEGAGAEAVLPGPDGSGQSAGLRRRERMPGLGFVAHFPYIHDHFAANVTSRGSEGYMGSWIGHAGPLAHRPC